MLSGGLYVPRIDDARPDAAGPWAQSPRGFGRSLAHGPIHRPSGRIFCLTVFPAIARKAPPRLALPMTPEISTPLPPPSSTAEATVLSHRAAGVVGGATGGDVGRFEGQVGAVDDGLQVVELGGQGLDALGQAVDAQGVLGEDATAEPPPGRGAVEVRRPAAGVRRPGVGIGRGAVALGSLRHCTARRVKPSAVKGCQGAPRKFRCRRRCTPPGPAGPPDRPGMPGRRDGSGTRTRRAPRACGSGARRRNWLP